jgi:hypothetical protein
MDGSAKPIPTRQNGTPDGAPRFFFGGNCAYSMVTVAPSTISS